MTGDDWLQSADGMAMYGIAYKHLTRRKQLLVCVELLTRLVDLPYDVHGRLLPEATFRNLEQLVAAEADGEIRSAYSQARISTKVDDPICMAALMGNADLLARAVMDTLELAVAIRDIPLPTSVVTRRDISAVRNWDTLARQHPERPVIRARESGYFADLIRDVVSNPFRPVAFDPRLRTADTLGVARGIYEDRAFDRMPLLADALMDAGCDDDQILSHCRTGGPHVRGCWVVDLVLGKE
jgi:hypothetical protein